MFGERVGTWPRGHGRPARHDQTTRPGRPCPLDKPIQAALLLRLRLHGYGLACLEAETGGRNWPGSEQTSSAHRFVGFVTLTPSLPLMSPCGSRFGEMLLFAGVTTPAGHSLALCLSPTARQFPVPRAAIRAGSRRNIRLHRLTAGQRGHGKRGGFSFPGRST